MTRPQPTEDDLLMDLIKTNDRTDGETITKKQYKKHGDYNPWQARNRFGSWNEAKASAGVYKEDTDQRIYTDTEILEDMKQVNDKVDGLMTIDKYREHGKHSISSIYNRFNSFTKARAKAYNI